MDKPGTLDRMTERGHEQVVFLNFPEVGLRAIVAIHNTVLGPSLGGVRLRAYDSEAEALEDVLRLSEAMTYKSAMAGLPLGGGKSCVIIDPRFTRQREELFLKLGECVESLSGRYIAAEDMGTSPRDISVMRRVTASVGGHPSEEGGSGDPSPWTARGVFQGIRAACAHRYGDSSLKGRRVLVEGVGNVGSYLVEHLLAAGAMCSICDTDLGSIARVKDRFPTVEVVDLPGAYDTPCDIFAPCAIGQTVNPSSLGRLSCDIIAGGANNQLSGAEVYPILAERGFLYCPDFIINAGGVTSIAGEFIAGGWQASWVEQKVDGIYETVIEVLREADLRGNPTEVVAIAMAKERVQSARISKGQV